MLPVNRNSPEGSEINSTVRERNKHSPREVALKFTLKHFLLMEFEVRAVSYGPNLKGLGRAILGNFV